MCQMVGRTRLGFTDMTDRFTLVNDASRYWKVTQDYLRSQQNEMEGGP
jgi:hypothetical protein